MLTKGQVQKVKGILEQTGTRLDRYFKLLQPEVRRVLDDNLSQIEKVLNEGQKERFRSIREG